MTDEAKRIVEALRMCPIPGYRCEQCPAYNPYESCQNELNAADLIEQLSEELEQEQQANAGLEIMLTAAQSAAETWQRRADELKYALMLMVSQYCVGIDVNGERYLIHMYMTAGEHAFKALGLKNYESEEVLEKMIDESEKNMRGPHEEP